MSDLFEIGFNEALLRAFIVEEVGRNMEPIVEKMRSKLNGMGGVPGSWISDLSENLESRVHLMGNTIRVEIGLLDGNQFAVVRALTMDTGSAPVGKSIGEPAMNIHTETIYPASGRMAGSPIPGKTGVGWLSDISEAEVYDRIREGVERGIERGILGGAFYVIGHNDSIVARL